MGEQMVTVDGVELWVDAVGDPGDPAVLLISGMAASMDWWEPAFCERLAAHRRFVVRYDHRDTGRSHASPSGKPDYTAEDLATDPLRVLDALGIGRAHLVGVSAGGGIAQELAARRPDRVATITLIATTAAGERSGTEPLPQAVATFDAPPSEDPVESVVHGERACAGGLGFDEERVRRMAEIAVDRGHDPGRAANHWQVTGSGWSFRMSDIAVPTLVLHGTDDPLFPFPHGEALAAEIPGAVLVPLPGMGHEVPPPSLWDDVLTAVVAHT